MKNIFYLIILLCFVDLLEVKSDKSDDDDEVLSQLNVDVKKIKSRKWRVIRKKNINFNNNDNNDYSYGGGENINNGNDADVFKLQWWGNGDFGKKHSSDFADGKLFQREDKIDSTQRDIKDQEEIEDDDELSSAPSRVLTPPFKYYSSSIHNLATENIDEYSTTTTTEFYNASNINSLRIYEITSSNLSTPDSTYDNKNDNKNYERSFMIEDPSRELKSFDSLRSVILNRQQGNVQANNYNNVDSYGKDLSTIGDADDDDKLLNINRDSVTRANRLLIKKSRSNKSFYLNRGNRKYQHAVDSDETRLVRDKTWSYPTDEKYTWKKIQRPINRDNNYRRFGTIVRVNTRPIENENADNGGVAGVAGFDYPIHHQHTHHRLQNIAARFLCPSDAGSHIYLADRASRCQIFYVCFGGDIGVPMVCPNGTLFSQELQVCDWWYNVTC